MLLESVDWLGHAGFRIDAEGAVVYIDPYRVEGGPPADVILITHGHYDHFSPLEIERLSHGRTLVVAPPQVAERVGGGVVSLRAGETLELPFGRGIDVTAVAAYNTSKLAADGRPFHPREAGCLGYELRVGGERLYHSGDTDVIPEMDAVSGVDVALLPVSGVYVMTAEEAAEAARRIDPRVAVPMHWGGHIGTRADAEAFERAAPVEVRIMKRAA
jgi:L-ascorbate metabolism protein UlaG (beta-lactamase superfamily)